MFSTHNVSNVMTILRSKSCMHGLARCALRACESRVLNRTLEVLKLAPLRIQDTWRRQELMKLHMLVHPDLVLAPRKTLGAAASAASAKLFLRNEVTRGALGQEAHGPATVPRAGGQQSSGVNGYELVVSEYRTMGKKMANKSGSSISLLKYSPQTLWIHFFWDLMVRLALTGICRCIISWDNELSSAFEPVA